MADVPPVNVADVIDEADNCTAAPIVTFVSDVSDGNTCPEVITRTYNIADDCGNNIDVVQTITVGDNVDPTGTAPAPKNRSFKTFTVGHPRAFDAEVKILENFARVHKNDPLVRGSIKIVSERPFCDSCTGVIKQFKKMFPNVEVTTVSGTK